MIQGGWKVADGSGAFTAYIVNADGADVACVSIGKGEYALARARLMAAAPEMAALLKQIMAAHRGQLPSECADLYGGGCGCPQCEQARALLVRVGGEG